MEPVQALLVTSTVSDKSSAKQIAKTLLEKRLAACINIFPVESYFTWEGEVKEEQEIKLFIKTSTHCLDSLHRELNAIHPYSVPEILDIQIQSGDQQYLQWLSAAVQS